MLKIKEFQVNEKIFSNFVSNKKVIVQKFLKYFGDKARREINKIIYSNQKTIKIFLLF